MNSQENIFNAEFDDAYIFPPNVEYAAQQQNQHQNAQYLVNNQIYPPQVEHQPIQQVYQPNIAYQVHHQINETNTEYQANNQFYQPNADLNMERKPSTSLPQKGKRTRTKYTDEQIKHLEDHFKKNSYITLKKKKELAVALGMEEQQIKKWYQNRRMKESAIAKRIANSREGNENLRLPSQSIGNVGGYDHQINLNPVNSLQYNIHSEATGTETPFNVNRTQNLGEPNENIHIRDPQNLNNYQAYNNPEVYGNNLIQSPGVTLLTPLDNFRPAPLQQNLQNILNNYGFNRNENLTQSFDVTPYQPLENFNPLQFREDQQNINFFPYNEHEPE